MHTAIIEKTGHRGLGAHQYDGAALEPQAGVTPDIAADDHSARQHTGAKIVTSIAFDQDESAPHAIGGAVACTAFDVNAAATHTLHIPRKCRAQEISHITGYVKFTAAHFAASEMTGVAVDVEAPAEHAKTGFVACRSFDANMAALKVCAQAKKFR